MRQLLIPKNKNDARKEISMKYYLTLQFYIGNNVNTD